MPYIHWIIVMIGIEQINEFYTLILLFSGRSSIAMFLGYSLHFRPILDRFDQRDGLRRLYNYCSTLKIMQKDDNTEDDSLDEINDEHYTLNILTLRNAIFAFKWFAR